VPFEDDMARAYAWADLVICRSGALTLAELAAAGVPAILVPFPAAHEFIHALTAVTGSDGILRDLAYKQEILAQLHRRDLVIVGVPRAP